MDQVNILKPFTMIALHLRDSPLHLITASQECGPGARKPSADNPFAARSSHALADCYL